MTTIYRTYMKPMKGEEWKVSMPTEVTDISVLASFFDLTEAEILTAVEFGHEISTTWMGIPQIFKIIKEVSTPAPIEPARFETIADIHILNNQSQFPISLNVSQQVGSSRGNFTVSCPTSTDSHEVETVTSNNIDLEAFMHELMDLLAGDIDVIKIPFGIMFQADGTMCLSFKDNTYSVGLFTDGTEVTTITWKEPTGSTAFEKLLTYLIIAFPT